MKKRVIVFLFLAIALAVASGCATMRTAGHKYMMKGQILEVNDGVAYLCIGSAEGAKAGQEFSVYRYLKLPHTGAKQAGPSYKRETVGSVKINQVVDEHFAKASILGGDIRVNDVAEVAP
jgi:predicted small secreted protein